MDGKLSSSVSNKQESTPIVPKKYIAHFIMLISCFVLWGLLNNMTDNLVPAFGRIFMLEAADASLTQVAFYGSYAVLALPAAILIKKYSYRTGVLVGLGLYIVGAMGYIPAAISQNFNLFLTSVFVLAGGLSILETTCNPYVISLGSPETSVRRLNLAQAFNPLGSLTGIIMAKYIILSNLNPATYEERVAMSPDALSAIRSNELLWVCVPYVGLVAIALVIWLFFKKSKDSEKDTSGELNITHSIKKLVRIPRYALGVVAQFFYVGVQIAVWTWTISYVMTNLGLDEAAASGYYLIAIISFIVCRWICTALMKYIDPAIMMAVFAVGGIVFSLGTIYLPTNQSVWCLVAISACMSLMFPTIYGIALKDLGEEVKVGAAGLIMAILGGAVITPIMGKMIDTGMLSSIVPAFTGAQAAVRSSFLIPAICFLVVLVYSLCFRTKKEA
ncbi:L-fucose:H+ symporter permease [Paraclostridium sordellii]|uniref:L-fucose:H+ symporter permease n=1 Tax=Paraclostridium sordellii TaxID=1505 RepID=UPI0005DAC217|nr:L-fucose:H+ symporter permease [Paeniclostridium sordellii]CEN87025.1 L-fucose permease [[Clostridium] sordellii] [Paeniclostridium sordellii]